MTLTLNWNIINGIQLVFINLADLFLIAKPIQRKHWKKYELLTLEDRYKELD